jgi:hypothetical protein
MKLLKKICAFTLALAVCFMCGVSAFAADTAEAQTKVTYTKTAEETPKPSPSSGTTYRAEDETDPEPSEPVYEIAIPSEFSLNTANTIPIYLTENSLAEGQSLEVLIDANQTISDDGYLHLQGTQGQSPAKVAIGYYTNSNYVEYVNASGYFEVALFSAGDVHPTQYGTLFFELKNEQELIADTYTGTIFFSMRVHES